MGRRNDHSKEELREMVINAAEHILIEEGYGKLTTRRIAKEIGYTVGSLYMVMKNIDELILLVNGRTLNALLDKIKLDLAEMPKASAEEELVQIAMSYIDFAYENKECWQAIFMHRLTDSSVLNDEYYAYISNLFHVIGDKLKKMSPEKSNEEIEILTRGLWGAVHGVTSLNLDHKFSIAAPVEFDTKKVVEILVRDALYGIQHRP